MRKEYDRDYIEKLVEGGYYLTTRQAAVYLGLSSEALEKRRQMGKEPHYSTFTRRRDIRYSAESLQKFRNKIET